MDPEATLKALHTPSIHNNYVLLIHTEHIHIIHVAKGGLHNTTHKEATQEVLKMDQERLNVDNKENRISRVILVD
jgi:hypothetical protein